MADGSSAWRQPPIADYGFLSDCNTAALVDTSGSVDWWCLPRFDSPSVFGRLLDPSAGHWTLQPAEKFETAREYLDDTLVLRTVFTTESGEVAVTDALATAPGVRGHDLGFGSPRVLMRQVEGLSGRVEMCSELAPRMEYGRTEPHLLVRHGGLTARGGPVELLCVAPVTWDCQGGTARASFTVSPSRAVTFRLHYRPAFAAASPPPAADDGECPSVEDTAQAWRSWADQHRSYDGPFGAEVRRSSIVLRGLTYQPSGAVVAAATTSLPELMGGDLNFDYRFAWLRDLSLTIRALWVATCPDEPARLFDWFATAGGRHHSELVQIMFGVEGERDLSEHVLEHLAGFRASWPVRVGNEAWKQKQLDVLGEVFDAVHLLRDSLGDLDGPVREMLVSLADLAADDWSMPDAGMWEARDAERHYTSSKVMCWVALDRAIDLAPRLDAEPKVSSWSAARAKLRSVILDEAWSTTTGAYTGAFGSDNLDASVLLLPLVGFLPASDDRMWATIEAIERDLGADGLVHRWSGDPAGFLICSYWLVECLALAGAVERAVEVFRRTTAYANDLGLLSEEADPASGEMLGNVPQAFSHVGLINAAWRIGEAAEGEPIDSSDAPTPNGGEAPRQGA